MKVTVTLTAVSVGTEMSIEQQGVQDVVPREGCFLGWQESLRKLANSSSPISLNEPPVPWHVGS